MKRIIFLASLIIMATSPVCGQNSRESSGEVCTSAVAQKIDIRGVRLGMSLDQVLALFPGSRENPEVRFALERAKSETNYGTMSLQLYPSYYGLKEKYAGIWMFGLGFLDERVVSLYVNYSGPEWRSVDEFVAKLAEAFDLPKEKVWKDGGERTKALTCGDLQFRVYAAPGNGSNTFHIHSFSAERVVSERRAEAKERERRAFKP